MREEMKVDKAIRSLFELESDGKAAQDEIDGTDNADVITGHLEDMGYSKEVSMLALMSCLNIDVPGKTNSSAKEIRTSLENDARYLTDHPDEMKSDENGAYPFLHQLDDENEEG